MILTAEIKRILDAMAFADVGEFLSTGQKTHYLNEAAGVAIAPAVAEQARPAGPRPQVALYVGSELSADVMDYVIQTCARLKHGLTVLTFQPESDARSLLDPYTETLANAKINLQLEMLSGEPVSGLTRYLRRHADVAFLACNETGYLGRGLRNSTQRLEAFPVPVVLVTSRSNDKPIAVGQLSGEAQVVRAG